MLRGLIMIFMALDHFVYFINRFHPAEFWNLTPPAFPSPAYAVFRFISHLCAPGFLFLAGTGLVLFAERRKSEQWSKQKIRRNLAIRGVLLFVVVQLLLETLAWALGDLGGRGVPLNQVNYPGVTAIGPFAYLGVIYALALSFALGSFLFSLRKSVLATIAAVSIAVSPIVLSFFESRFVPIHPLLNMLFVPGISLFFTNYPLFPWFGLFLLGMILGRALAEQGSAVLSHFWWIGLIVLVAGIGIRFVRPWGEFHRFDPARILSFFELSKYPPSSAFLGITLGLLAVLLSLFDWIESRRPVNAAARLMEVYGREPLFFYVLHLFVYAGASFLFVFGRSPLLTIGGWLISLALFTPVLLWFHRVRSAGRIPRFLGWM
jgi:uncharacterized membrane protein